MEVDNLKHFEMHYFLALTMVIDSVTIIYGNIVLPFSIFRSDDMRGPY